MWRSSAMDSYKLSSTLRARALQKIAELSAPNSEVPAGKSNFDRLYHGLGASKSGSDSNGNDISNGQHGSSLAKTPMTLDELHVLLALCEAAPLISSSKDAERLFSQLSPYLLEAHEQAFRPSPFLLSLETSPWETISSRLTTAVLSLGIRNASLARPSVDIVFRYLNGCVKSGKEAGKRVTSPTSQAQHGPVRLLKLAMSVVGFLESVSRLAHALNGVQRIELVRGIQSLLSEDFMVAVEGALSSLRNSGTADPVARDVQQVVDTYQRCKRPLGAMFLQQGFMRVLVSCGSLQIAAPSVVQKSSILDFLMQNHIPEVDSHTELAKTTVEVLSEIAADSMRVLEDEADYLELASTSRQHLAHNIRSHALVTYLTCIIVDDDIADTDILMTWLDGALTDAVQMADLGLAGVVFKCLAIVAKTSPTFATSLSRLIPRFIVQSGNESQCVEIAARSFSTILQLLSPDAAITSLYSLGNVLSASSAEATLHANGTLSRYTQHSTASAISFDAQKHEDAISIYTSIVRAIITVATTSEDKKIVPLAQSMLLQKISKVDPAVDCLIITETAALAAVSEQSDLKSLLKVYDRFGHDAVLNKKENIIEAVRRAHVKLALAIPKSSPCFNLYMSHLLESIVGKGDIQYKREKQDQPRADTEVIAEEICQLLLPLSILAPHFAEPGPSKGEDNLSSLQREVWFNLAVHGIVPGTNLWQKYLPELRELAIHTKPLVAEDRADHLESDIELNTVLRRGQNGPYIAEMKRSLIKVLPTQESIVRSLTYEKLMFLHATYAVESLRAEHGACTGILSYFIDRSVNQEGMRSCMEAIAHQCVKIFLSTCESNLQSSSVASTVSKQLAKVLAFCCHRIQGCRSLALTLASEIIEKQPPALCQKSSLFALLELLSIMWSSCLDAEIDEFEWKSQYTSTLSDIRLALSDNHADRKETLRNFHKKAKYWVSLVISVAPMDVKGLFQTYLAEYDDEGAYGHIALGRSFAVEMGSLIPNSDPRLGAIDSYGVNDINTASDFVAQYTTRQEYKHAEAIPRHDREWVDLLHLPRKHELRSAGSSRQSRDAQAILTVLDRRATYGKYTSFAEIRDLLRRAAAIVCRSDVDQSAIIHHLVSIPFSIFSKQSMKLGISLWLGVINENPSMEPRILTEILTNWESSVQKKKGIFSEGMEHPDPFFLKEEYAPSDRQLLCKKQQIVANTIAPHLRVLQLLSSHLEAYRLGSPNLRRAYQRMISVTLDGLMSIGRQPLTREFHFQTILLALTLLKYSSDMSYPARWRLKDKILSTGLSWFAQAPRFSFGGNRIQVGAECKLMRAVLHALKYGPSIGSSATTVLKSLHERQELLNCLILNELTRLNVWLDPAPQDSKAALAHGDKQNLAGISPQLLKVAWTESSSLALFTAIRAQSATLMRDVRGKLLTFTEDAIDEPEALHLLLSGGLSSDVSIQLKYLLYWTPINPISAVTYFLPAYQNHPFILQYAMRALESHSVDITFFYVPQIVQTLRYDALGYVQRYIVETASVSQLFAHQIIWNMKANAYKDEDSTIEDEIKPTLDAAMQNMVESFAPADKAFYEKEFAFFNEVTGVSGKLRPYIKREKAEKKAKIEEELRKIKVEVGVYLPCNPEGSVIGIDRKSGKPLQSHAKAPYMATFRIRKNKTDLPRLEDQFLEDTTQSTQLSRKIPNTQETTYDVWQSAIFKVGDDCRQDTLALQMISAFRNIFNDVGLDVWVYPYQVTATAPGCGVIDVLPNSISRDMLGREAVNGLYLYFQSKYGEEDSIRFQEARSNFVKSMASYSVISYLLQFKDRHNGNIMIDDAGHIIHIDFGFCFDIAPGGVRFERAPFKLTSEMVAVMGGNTESQSFRWFEQLCVKAFLASRPYAQQLSHLVTLMLDSGLPCFKPDTIQHFKERFVLGKTEREAADFMRDLVRKSLNSYSTRGYDQFQLLTNGIPY